MKINDLIKLAEIITPNKLKELAILTPKEDSTKVLALYNYMVEGKHKDENELMELLYPKQDNKKIYYNRLKRQLGERLINTLFIIDANQTQTQTISQAYYYSYKNAVAVKILVGKRARATALVIAKKAFAIAEKFEFTDILLYLSKELRTYYGTVARDRKKFQYYNEKVKYFANVFLAESTAEEYYSELTLLTQSRSPQVEYREIIRSYADEVGELILQYHSYRLNLFAFTIIAMQYEMIHDYDNTIITCERALNYFNQKKHLASKAVIFTFYFRKISSLILLGRLETAIDAIEKCLALEAQGTPNWYKLQEYRIIVNFHSHKYQEAYAVYLSVIENKSFKSQFPDIKEAWYIYETFIYYFYIQNVLEGIVNDRLKKFRISRFLNEVPTYSKDKRGMNTAILILHVLFLLHQKQYGKIIDRTEALRTYTHRYLRQDETFRSNCFIKMLMQLPKANFHRAAVERKTKELREKLSSVGIIQNQSAEVEIVPYEVLWEFVLESLDNKIH